jgi:hypothetical protein
MTAGIKLADSLVQPRRNSAGGYDRIPSKTK